MLKLLVFVLTSAVFVYVSRASLRDPRSHGFYRFFAWEAVLALTLLNLDRWFHDPLTWHQLVSWPLLMASLFLVIHGVQLLKHSGRQDPRRDDAPMLEFEKTTALVTAGAYRYIRHPLYSSLLFLTWGVFFKNPTWIGISLALAASLFLVITAKIEEAENVRFFGPAYQAYVRQTRMFIPFLF
jgi:protein-S-isoprenylcysteine O-methyltransferase Ste14